MTLYANSVSCTCIKITNRFKDFPEVIYDLWSSAEYPIHLLSITLAKRNSRTNALNAARHPDQHLNQKRHLAGRGKFNIFEKTQTP